MDLMQLFLLMDKLDLVKHILWVQVILKNLNSNKLVSYREFLSLSLKKEEKEF